MCYIYNNERRNEIIWDLDSDQHRAVYRNRCFWLLH